MSTAPLWTSGAMAQAMRASVNGALPEAVTGLSIDSRSIAPGEAYFAIKGDVHDGHDFVAAALKAGAVLAVAGDLQRRTGARGHKTGWAPDPTAPVSLFARSRRAVAPIAKPVDRATWKRYFMYSSSTKAYW